MRKVLDSLIKKLSTTEAKSLIGVFCLIMIILYIWMKVEQAKERERNRRRGRRNANNADHNQYANARGAAGGNNQALYNARDEIRRLSARQRYLESSNWANQCICLCLEQLIDHNVSNGRHLVSFKHEQIVVLLKQLANKHRLYIIHLLPNDVIATLNNDRPYEQSEYELDVINLFVKHAIVDHGLAKHKILFCTTRKGKSSMVRQLMPTLYIDSDEFVLKQLYQHLTEVVQITPLLAAGGVAPTVFVSNSVLSYFA
eukprot:CAMPEP_0197078746 /NCGR_PEP_ID=MMETSP1384-20130603/213277_1 /TAXON_ID=29189 /ORGANISM="Ammonia sp." /LENGTH=256 /DNA_ID=CAMNT_0042517615 /DNA_START=709 /DNA_END=1479 /DNA_ORIENTATION=+